MSVHFFPDLGLAMTLCTSEAVITPGKKWTDMKMSYFHTLLAEVCTGVAPEVNAKALAWGKQYEEDARTLFEFTTDVKVTESPILFRDESCTVPGPCTQT